MHITIDVNVKGLEELSAILTGVLSPRSGNNTVNPVSQSTLAVGLPTSVQPSPAPNVTQFPVTAPAAQSAPAVLPTVGAPMAAGAAVTGNMATAAAVPIATPQVYTQEQLAVAAMQLMDAGRRQDLVNLLAQFGVPALTALPKEQYGNFATQLRALGAKL